MGRYSTELVNAAAGPVTEGPDPAILAAAATGIVDYIKCGGGDIDSIFGNSGIAPEMAGSPTLKLKLTDFCRLFEEASTGTRCDNFGLWFGNQFRPRDLGLWGYAMVSAPTLGSALENMVGLFGYHQEQSVMSLGRDSNGLLRLEYQIRSPLIVDRRQDAELSLGMFLNVIREACGTGWAPEEVHFEHPRPDNHYEHSRAFDAPVYFSQPTNVLLFRDNLLSRPMPASDLTLMALSSNCLMQLSNTRNRPITLFDQVCSAIRSGLATGYPALEHIARELQISPGTVQRELAQHGIAFKGLVESLRRELAMSYLRQRHLPISEISLLLGYSELSAFSRAVKRWTGAPPSAVREALLQS